MEDTCKTLEFKNLIYDVRNTNPEIKSDYARIIDSLSGKVESGKLTAILGSSGCGKTHLLKMLTGDIEKNSKTSGKILFNGVELEANDRMKKIHYLPQDDVFYADMTVYDHLMFYGSLGSKKDIKDRIERALTSCLILHKKHSLMGSLSGGERKRALIAAAIINDSEILILDEPTTGLDSNTALEIIYTLKKYAESNNSIVISTIHQPGSGLFNLFEDLFVLTNGGLFYSGPVKELVPFFEANNILKDDTLSIPEFLFVILTSNSHHPDAIKYKGTVQNIIQRNVVDQDFKNPEVCNNTRNITWNFKFSDILILSRFLFKYYLRKKGTLKNFLVWSNIGCTITVGPLIRIIISFILKLDSSGVSEDLKMCSYWEKFLISFCFFRYLFVMNFYFIILMSYNSTFHENTYFKSEYINGRYNFGTYFFYSFFSNLFKNCVYLYLSLPLYLIVYWRVLLMNPLILFFIILFIFISAFLFTISLLLAQFIFIFYFPPIFGLIHFITVPKDHGEVIMGKDETKRYFFLLYPIYNFIVYMRTKCYGLVGDVDLKSLSNLSRFLTEIDVDGVLSLSTSDIPSIEIIYNLFKGDISDLIMISSIILPCLISIGILILSLIFFKVPIMRFKLEKTN